MDFEKVRHVGGSARTGFEELCVQLVEGICGARLSNRVRVDGSGGDGGVELIATAEDCRRIGIQAKYFGKTLGTPQWSQIDRSVKEAMSNHPDLTDYYVCTHKDRNPAQAKSWDTLQDAWKLSYRHLRVHWVGHHELTNILTTPRWRYLATYWLDAPEFSFEAAQRRTEAAIKQLHRRFTPKINNRTTAELQLSRMLALSSARLEHHARCVELAEDALKLRDKLGDARWSDSAHALTAACSVAIDVCHALVDNIADGELLRQVASYGQILEDATQNLRALASAGWAEESRRRRESDSTNPGSSPSSFARSATELVEKIEVVLETLSLLTRAGNSQVWLMTGQGGMGKSHLLATVARNAIRDNSATLMFLGEQFQDNSPVSSQICEQLHWGRSFDDLLACLQARAAEAGRPSLIIVDAINETPNKGIWKTQLISLQADIERYPFVYLLISCRDDWVQTCLPEPLSAEAPTVHHRGYDLNFAEAVAAYFTGYEVSTDTFPPLLPEFRNPLFLKTVCETYQGRRLPAHPLSFVEVLAAWEDRIGEEIERAIDCPRSGTKQAINRVVHAMAASGSAFLDEDVVRRICSDIFPVPQEQRSLYRQLQTQGFMEEVPRSGTTQVRLQYDRFYDVRVAQAEVEAFANAAAWQAHWEGNILRRINANTDVRVSSPKLFAYALLVPEKFGIELPELRMPELEEDDWDSGESRVWDAWIDALAWRQIPNDHDKVRVLFSAWSRTGQSEGRIYGELFTFGCIEQHPLNADFFHTILADKDFATREEHWTAAVADQLTDAAGIDLLGFTRWCDGAKGLCSDEQARLASILLIWVTSTTNWSERDRATAAATRLLEGRGEVAHMLFETFWQVDDPYVLERLLAIIAGVIPTLDQESLGRLASTVCRCFFASGPVPLNMMQREYARFIAEYAQRKGALDEALIAAATPPYDSTPVQIWSEEQVGPYENDRRFHTIAASLKPEGMGMYGDFGRYVMGGKVEQFVDASAVATDDGSASPQHPREDPRAARRYIWSRIRELGWTPERFSEFEAHLSSNGRQRARIERISKKFQWIGLYEYLGYLMDNRTYMEYGADEGADDVRASDLMMRDYDPSAAAFDGVASRNTDKPRMPTQRSGKAVPTMSSTRQRRAWVITEFDPFLPYLNVSIDGAPRLVLSGHFSLSEELPFGRSRMNSEHTSQWVDVRSFIVPIKYVDLLASQLTDLDFWGKGVELPRVYDCWLSEYPWHPMLDSVTEACASGSPWLRPLFRRGVLHGTACSLDSEERHFVLPSPVLFEAMSRSAVGPLAAPRHAEVPGYRIDDRQGEAIFWGSADNRETILAADYGKLMACLSEGQFALMWCCLSEKRLSHDSDSQAAESSQSSVIVHRPFQIPVETRGRRRDFPAQPRSVRRR